MTQVKLRDLEKAFVYQSVLRLAWIDYDGNAIKGISGTPFFKVSSGVHGALNVPVTRWDQFMKCGELLGREVESAFPRFTSRVNYIFIGNVPMGIVGGLRRLKSRSGDG